MKSGEVFEDPWCQHIPLLHRILIDPTLIEEFPRPTEARTLEQSCANWETLHYLLTVLLGWEHPGRGLAWWYQQNKPVDDSVLLTIVKEIWGHANALDYYAAWSWLRDRPGSIGMGCTADELADLSLYGDAKWWRKLVGRAHPKWDTPLFGGYNPLHLGHTEWFGRDEVEEPSKLRFDMVTRTAILIVNHIGTWRSELETMTERLPLLKARSWRVQVVDRTVGFLGQFRQSRETGQWFLGKHSIHRRGRVLEGQSSFTT